MYFFPSFSIIIGIYDMHGNVWEWTQDCYNYKYEGTPLDGNAWLPGYCYSVVVRGGSWRNVESRVRASFRGGGVRANRINNTGFRLARDL